VRGMLRGGLAAPPVAVEQQRQQLAAYSMAVAYESILATYSHSPAKRAFYGRIVPGQRNYTVWLRAAELADALKADYETFVRAQFFAFDQWFSRAPKPWELGSTKSKNNAAVRYWNFLKQNPDVEVASKQQAVVDTTTPSGRRQALSTSRAARFSASERALQVMMKNYKCTAERIFALFETEASAASVFDTEWLSENALWKQVHAQKQNPRPVTSRRTPITVKAQ